MNNHLSLALRQLKRRKGFTLINVTGLSIGLASCILIMLYVHHERSMDDFHEKKDRIFRITESHIQEGELASAYFPLYGKLGEAFPEIEDITRIYPGQGIVHLENDQQFTESTIYYADPEFFRIFSFPLSLGDTASFSSPQTVIISPALATKYFGEENPVGKTIRYENLLSHEDQEGTKQLKIAGVLEKVPANSHLQPDMLISMATLSSVAQWEKYGWYYPPVYTYLSLNDPAAAGKIETGSRQILAENTKNNDEERRSFHLQPLGDIHLRSDMNNEIHQPGSEQVVEIFTVAAVFILFLAIFNYVNLSTARSIGRAREVGVKKTLGASRPVLVRQFLAESFLLVLISGVLAFTLVQVSLPSFASLLQASLSAGDLFTVEFSLLFVGGLLLVGALAGFYPAFVLSSFRPASAIRGRFQFSPGGSRIRKVLVVAQFTIAVALIAGTSLVYHQLQYINRKDLGFEQEHTLVASIDFHEFQTKLPVLQNELLSNSDVAGITFVSNLIGANDQVYAYPIEFEGNTEGRELELNIISADSHTDKFFNLQIIEGRYFSENSPADFDKGIVINESAARLLGWEEAVNKNLTIKYIREGRNFEGRVIGVVKDFHLRSLHHNMEPLAIIASGDPSNSYDYDYLYVKTAAGVPPSAAMQTLTAAWESIESGKPLEAWFLEDRIDRLYDKESRTGSLFGIFAVIAIFISCLGLYGMAAYNAEVRRKEVCIRKILGASMPGIVRELSRSYVLLISVAGLLGSFTAWQFGKSWLQGFAYKAELSPWVFIIAFAIVLFISLLTVIGEILKVARINPAENLRNE